MTPAEVKEARENLGWTLEKLAIQAGLSGTTIWAYAEGPSVLCDKPVVFSSLVIRNARRTKLWHGQ